VVLHEVGRFSLHNEIKVAYEHFFEGFDKGEQKFQYQFRIGGVTSEMGWLMAAGNDPQDALAQNPGRK
jgi:hypothetical protein